MGLDPFALRAIRDAGRDAQRAAEALDYPLRLLRDSGPEIERVLEQVNDPLRQAMIADIQRHIDSFTALTSMLAVEGLNAIRSLNRIAKTDVGELIRQVLVPSPDASQVVPLSGRAEGISGGFGTISISAEGGAEEAEGTRDPLDVALGVILTALYVVCVIDMLLILRAQGKLDESLLGVLLALAPLVAAEGKKRLQ